MSIQLELFVIVLFDGHDEIAGMDQQLFALHHPSAVLFQYDAHDFADFRQPFVGGHTIGQFVFIFGKGEGVTSIPSSYQGMLTINITLSLTGEDPFQLFQCVEQCVGIIVECTVGGGRVRRLG